MRFTADGVDIPDELLWAQDEGRTVFFCGAGVSSAKAQLPSFNGLTQNVLDLLGASKDDDARKLFEFAETARQERGVRLAISDQVFQLLRRRFNDTDINAKVAEILKPAENVDLSAHKTLLKLAKLRSGQTRIVTTNFDRLFESCNSKLASVTRSNFPHLAFNESDWGIVHLHGCVEIDYGGATRDGFVLSSASFGDAYLAMGWARDFVREILNRYVAVFVGYSADDPPVRYLLEGLQQATANNRRAYAFQVGHDDGASAAWAEKGVTALTYDLDHNCGHSRLWNTLDAWTVRNADPMKWRTNMLRKAQRGPAHLQPHERGIIAHIVNSNAGARAFMRHEPSMSAEWLCVFDPAVRYGAPGPEDGSFIDAPQIDPHDRYRLDSDPPPKVRRNEFDRRVRMPEDVWSAFSPNTADLRELSTNQVASVRGHFARMSPYLPQRLGALATWVAATAHHPAAAWWAGQQIALHSDVLDRIHLDQDVAGSATPIVRAWQAIREYNDLLKPERDHAWDLRLRIGSTGWDESCARKYADYFCPRLAIDTTWRRPVPPRIGSKLKLRDLVRIEVNYPEHMHSIDVPDEYLRPLIPKLRSGLELAEDLERRYSYGIDICSIEPDDEDSSDDGDTYGRNFELSGHVLLFVKLLKRLAKLSPQAARIEFEAWPLESAIFDRLRTWAAGTLDIVPASVYANVLLSLSPDGFWPFRGERDLLLGLARRWGELDKAEQKAIEARILNGPPRYKRIKEKDYPARSAYWKLSRLNWLHSKGCEFSFDIFTMNSRLSKIAPSWRPELAKSAAESHDGKGGWVRTDTDYSEIRDLPDEDVIAYIEAMERRPAGKLVSFDPFLGLSKENPVKALSSLSARTGGTSFPASFWDTFLRHDVRTGDDIAFSCSIAHELLNLCDDEFLSISRGVSDWFEKVGNDLLDARSVVFEQLWQRFISVLTTDRNPSKDALARSDNVRDWSGEAINSAAGNLAELAVSIPVDPAPAPGVGFPPSWIKRIEDLLALPGDLRCYALVIFGFQLHWLYWIDPNWAKANILSVLDEGNSSRDDQDAIWSGFLWSARTPSLDLFEQLKPHLMLLAGARGRQRDRGDQVLAGILLAGWGSRRGDKISRIIANEEMRTLLIDSATTLRQQVLWYLQQWSREESEWSSQLIEFLQNAWPKHKDLRTSEISARLCELALSRKSDFPEVVAVVSRLVTKVMNRRLFIPELKESDSDEDHATSHPRAMLELLYAVLPENSLDWPHGAAAALRRIGSAEPTLRSDLRYIELEQRLA